MSEQQHLLPPGAFRPGVDHHGAFERIAKKLPEGALVLLDAKVARLHPRVLRALRSRAPRRVLKIPGGERAKTMARLEQVLIAGADLPRSGALIAIGGGTIGDLGTVAAHLIKRGVSLHHVPTTVLAAVDSSLGGKGAVHVGVGDHLVKNLAGAFHSPDACWICPEFFTTLTPEQIREGAVEAWKMALTLDAAIWDAWFRRPPALPRMIREARALKEAVCVADPYEQQGLRRVLNFGHTFGHVLESVSDFRIHHGEAVGLGMRCALDVGRALGITPGVVADQVESILDVRAQVLSRDVMSRWLRKIPARAIGRLLAADKKAGADGALVMVLLEKPGATTATRVAPREWQALYPAWQQGVRP